MEIRIYADSKTELESQIRAMGFCKETPVSSYPAGKGQIPPWSSSKYQEMVLVVENLFNPKGQKIKAIKFVRAMCNCSLKDAKDFVDRVWDHKRVIPLSWA